MGIFFFFGGMKRLFKSANILFFLEATGVTATDDEPQRLVVDYNDADQIKSVLQDNKVEVVVSALLLADEQVAKSQINLIRGAARSGTVVKFIPSEYYIDFHAPIE